MKIGGGVGLALAALLAVGGVAFRTTERLIDDSRRVARTHRTLEAMDNVLGDLRDAETGQRGYVIAGAEEFLEPHRRAVAAMGGDLETLRGSVAGNPRQGRRLAALEALIREKLQQTQAMIDLRRENGLESAVAEVKSGKGRDLMDRIRAALGEMRAEEKGLLEKRDRESDRSARNATATIAAGVPLACLLLCGLGLVFALGISRALREVAVAAERMAEGDLSVHIPLRPRGDEVGTLVRTFARMADFQRKMAVVAGQIAAGRLDVEIRAQSERDVLGTAFAAMTANLRRTLVELSEVANALAATSDGIVVSTTQLAASASQTAAAVAQTTMTVAEVRQIAETADQKARSVADSALQAELSLQSGKQATEAAGAGMARIRQQMQAIAGSMDRLSEQTQAIGQIIATADDLAAQSNLLAVNAAIEAAKAGEQGRGFAVVAQEVKSLAEQTKQATAQVGVILNDIQTATANAAAATEQGGKAVEQGAQQSAQAGESIRKMSESVAEAAGAAEQIAASSGEQRRGVDQVASSMISIKQASTQNVVNAMRLEATARDLNELGRKMKGLIGRYQTDVEKGKNTLVAAAGNAILAPQGARMQNDAARRKEQR